MPVEENDEQSAAAVGADDTKDSRPSSYEKEEGVRLGTKEDSREADAQKKEDAPEPRDNLRDGT